LLPEELTVPHALLLVLPTRVGTPLPLGETATLGLALELWQAQAELLCVLLKQELALPLRDLTGLPLKLRVPVTELLKHALPVALEQKLPLMLLVPLMQALEDKVPELENKPLFEPVAVAQPELLMLPLFVPVAVVQPELLMLPLKVAETELLPLLTVLPLKLVLLLAVEVTQMLLQALPLREGEAVAVAAELGEMVRIGEEVGDMELVMQLELDREPLNEADREAERDRTALEVEEGELMEEVDWEAEKGSSSSSSRQSCILAVVVGPAQLRQNLREAAGTGALGRVQMKVQVGEGEAQEAVQGNEGISERKQ